MSDLSTLMDALISDSQLSYGAPLEWMQAQNLVARPTQRSRSSRPHSPRWTEQDIRFYRENIGILSYEEIAAHLGRSVDALHVYRVRHRLPAITRAPGYLTTCQVARILGVDGHNPPAWVDAGVMPGEVLPVNGRPIRRVSWVAFKLWLVRPTSWIYFKVERIKNRSFRRLVELAMAKWGDTWLTARQAAELIGCTTEDIDRQIKLGKLDAYKAVLLGGRREKTSWSYWFVRQSDVEKLVIHKKGSAGKGGAKGAGKDIWSPRADAFMLKARMEGHSNEDIARMMKWSETRVRYRMLKLLKERGAVLVPGKGGRQFRLPENNNQ